MKRVRRVVVAQLLVIAAVLLGAAWAARTFPVLNWIAMLQERVAQMGDWAPLFYALLIAACNLLLLPGGVLAVGSGLLFGIWWGFVVNLAGNATGAMIAFAIGRLLGRQRVERRLARYAKWRKLDRAIEKEGPRLIFFTQVHPLFPTSLLNYLYGITRIRAWSCLLWLTLGQAPGLFLYSYLGTMAQYGIRLLRGKSHPLLNEYVIWLGGLGLTFLVTTALGMTALRILRHVNDAPEA